MKNETYLLHVFTFYHTIILLTSFLGQVRRNHFGKLQQLPIMSLSRPGEYLFWYCSVSHLVLPQNVSSGSENAKIVPISSGLGCLVYIEGHLIFLHIHF